MPHGCHLPRVRLSSASLFSTERSASKKLGHHYKHVSKMNKWQRYPRASVFFSYGPYMVPAQNSPSAANSSFGLLGFSAMTWNSNSKLPPGPMSNRFKPVLGCHPGTIVPVPVVEKGKPFVVGSYVVGS